MKSVPEFQITKPGVYDVVLFLPRSEMGEDQCLLHEVPNVGFRACTGCRCSLCRAEFKLYSVCYGELGDNEEQLKKIIIPDALWRALEKRELLPVMKDANTSVEQAKPWVSVQVTFKRGEYTAACGSLEPTNLARQTLRQAPNLNSETETLSVQDISRLSTDFRCRIARHSEDPNIMNELMGDERSRVRINCIHNPIFEAHERAMEDEDPSVRSICARETKSHAILETLANDFDASVRARVAANAHLSEALMTKLSRDSSPEVLGGLCQNKELSPTLIERFCMHTDQNLRRTLLIYLSKVPESVFKKMIPSSSTDNLILVAEHASASDEVMKQLAGSPHPKVRCVVALHARTEAVLKLLYGDSDPRVLYFVSRNPNTNAVEFTPSGSSFGEVEQEIRALYANKKRPDYYTHRHIIALLFNS